jgi:hypothetical protein
MLNDKQGGWIMAQESVQQPVVNMKGRQIVQIGIVVADAAKTAKRYGEIFGIGPWRFVDIVPTNVTLHGKPLKEGASCIRAALAQLQDLQIELLQPLYGPSTHMEFLKEHGEGIHHFSFGAVDDHDQIVSALQEKGIGTEMQGRMGGTFSYMATQKELGAIVEVAKIPPSGTPRTVFPWGRYTPAGPGLFNMEKKRIVQIGIVVEDVEAAAKNYWELLGIGRWIFIDLKPPYVADFVLHGVEVTHREPCIRVAAANQGSLQLELLEPASGPSSHLDFLKTHGPGIHHVSFGAVDDHDTCISIFKAQGIGVEMTGLLNGSTFSYMASQKDLGTIYELVKPRQGGGTDMAPRGFYPPKS